MQQQAVFFATCAKGVEDLLAQECKQQGITSSIASTGGVEFTGLLESAYRLCLWSRVASRVLLKLDEQEIADDEALYRFASSIDWQQHLTADNTFVVECASVHPVINNSHYASLRIKDAVTDQLRERCGERPSVSKQQPDVCIYLYLGRQQAILYIDLSGEPLHRRGNDRVSGIAPLRETLAAAMLYRCKWPQLASERKSFADIMCGSGTLLTEAAAMAAGRASQLRRDYFGFLQWQQHQPDTWQALLDEANAAISPDSDMPAIVGFEKSHKALDIARTNVATAGFDHLIELKQSDSLQQRLALPATPGLVLTNPPYGKRLGDSEQLKPVYKQIGQCFKQQFSGWQAAIITSEKSLAQCIGLRAHHRNTLYNGALKCTLYQYQMRERDTAAETPRSDELHQNAVMLKNRLQKNMRHINRWAKQHSVSCYRLYDADIPQYAVAIDRYQDAYVIQEYQAPGSVPGGKAMQHLDDVVQVVQQLTGASASNIILKTRKRQSGKSQYQAEGASGRMRTVTENDLQFRVNLHDYLDTGLFLDHRDTRMLIKKHAAGKRVLNLIAYTGSFSVYAAAGDARSVTTVDLSNTYLEWARENMQLNGFRGDNYDYVRADCLQWIAQADTVYDLIVLDPPTFSNSKRMDATLDIRRDHVELVKSCMSLLSETGMLLFSCNARQFKLDQEALAAFRISDLTRQTTTEDFRRKPQHVCWRIEHSSKAD